MQESVTEFLQPRVVKVHAKSRENIESAVAGEIVAAMGLNDTITGDTLTDEIMPISLESMDFPEGVISMSVAPSSDSFRAWSTNAGR